MAEPDTATSGSSAILFDIDGTLIDSTYHHALAWQRAFAEHDVDVPHWRVHRAIGMGGDRIVAHLVDEDLERRLGDELRDAWRTSYAELRHEVKPLPGAAELVRAVREEGHRVALASSGDPEFSREAMEMLELGDVVELLTTAEDVDDSKPEPDLLHATLEQLDGVSRAVLVGDTPYDVRSAAGAGLGCITVLAGGFGRTELLDAGAVFVADSPEDLVPVAWDDYLQDVR